MAAITIPELLGRRDLAPAGEWTVDACAPVRGQPHVIIAQQRMVVPDGDDDRARVIRAHEMMHAKVSPADYGPWAARGRASMDTLKVCEEVRVNLLAQRAGFDMKKHMATGEETATGEILASRDDWTAAVHFAVACAGTASLRPYLTGIRRHKPEWSDALRAVAERVEKLLGKLSSGDLGATHIDRATGMGPAGFLHTEQVAAWVETIANPPQPDPDDQPGQPAESGQPGGRGQTQPGDGEPGDDQADPGEPPVSAADIKKRAEHVDMGEPAPRWAPLVVERKPMPRLCPGGLGKRRRPADTGKHLRYPARVLTDPERRVFARDVRANGGVVLIDTSGSMQITARDVVAITNAAPGATVAATSGRASAKASDPNLFVLADGGRMAVEADIKGPGGQNVADLAAVQWAIARRQRPTTPVVWVTDGLVHGPGQRPCDEFTAACVDAARAGRVILRPHVAAAIDTLHDLAKGRRAESWWPEHMIEVYRRRHGITLRSAKIEIAALYIARYA